MLQRCHGLHILLQMQRNRFVSYRPQKKSSYLEVEVNYRWVSC